jgi:hypothetical protein
MAFLQSRKKKLFVKNGIFVGDRLLRAGKKNG